MKLLLNLLITLVLVLLLATPGIFSANLVDFEKDFGIAISNNVGKFGNFLRLSEDTTGNSPEFNLEFTKFDNSALYRSILTVENSEKLEKLVQIVNNNRGVSIYFDTGGETTGPAQVKLLPGQKAEINLLVPPNPQTKTTSFSLKVD